MSGLSFESLANKRVSTTVFRIVATLFVLGIMWRHQGISILPIRLTDIIIISPLAASIFFKDTGRPFWLLWGIAIGGLLMIMALMVTHHWAGNPR